MTQKLLRELFDYHEDGFFIRKKLFRGSFSVHTKINEYKMFVYNYKWRSLHRCIFMWHHGWLPDFLDHINQDKLDNRIENLRPATRAQNAHNRTSYKGSSSKFKGVSWHKYRNKYQASIRKNGKQYYLGIFDNAKDAARAYDKKAIELFGEFASLNINKK